ncbi:hypothetical protein P8452_08740 [Trifolium repens]|nr:hypothetical protein P8452_08740 [Trifolium repens]
MAQFSIICSTGVFIKECSNGFSKSKVHKLGFDWELLQVAGSSRSFFKRTEMWKEETLLKQRETYNDGVEAMLFNLMELNS